jgi:hypothetical protein
VRRPALDLGTSRAARRQASSHQAAIAEAALVTPLPLEWIGAPTLVVPAKDAPAAVPAGGLDTAEHIPGATLTTLERGGHVILGHHAEVEDRVRAFLAANAPATPVAASRDGAWRGVRRGAGDGQQRPLSHPDRGKPGCAPGPRLIRR